MTSRKLRPVPASESVRLRIKRQPSRDTPVELELRRVLHRRRLRFRVHVQPLASVRRTVDVVFARQHIAVFNRRLLLAWMPASASMARGAIFVAMVVSAYRFRARAGLVMSLGVLASLLAAPYLHYSDLVPSRRRGLGQFESPSIAEGEFRGAKGLGFTFPPHKSGTLS
jgi:hypothetical protein